MTSVVHKCPPAQVLARYILGQLEDVEAVGVREHMGGCKVCRDKFGTEPTVSTSPAPNPRNETLMMEPGFATLTPAPRLQPGPPDTMIGEPIKIFSKPDHPPRSAYHFLRPPQEPGELGRLGPYAILAEVGQGGMGLVFKAKDVQLDRTVALKVMKPDFAQDPRARARFLQEAKAAAGLDHRHIVAVHQVGEDNGAPFISMQYLKGETLESRLLREKPLPVTELARIAKEVSLGLAAAHAAGLVHRDIKPANIWLEEGTGQVKILDFGLARYSDQQNLTRTGTIVGTPAYMSPEQASGKPLDHRSDLFSLGSMLYVAATGQMPFAGEDEMATLFAIVRERPRAITEWNKECPEMMVRAIMKLLHKHPDDRVQTAAETAEMFTLLLQEFRPRKPSTKLERLKAPPPAQESRRMLFLAIGLAFATMVIGFAVFRYGKDFQRMMEREFPGRKKFEE